MELERLDPDNDRQLREVLELETAALAVDEPYLPQPRPTAARAFRRYGWDGEPAEEWLARGRDGRVAGRVDAYLPYRENQHTVWCGVLVHPSRRRQGIGRWLFGELTELVRRPGRRLMIGYTLDAPGPRAFAEGLGFTRANVDVYRRQDLRTVDWGRVEKLRARAREAARGYTLLRLTGPVPEELVAEVAAMEEAINDAPRGGLDTQDEVITAARVRARERTVAAAGLREYRLVARRERDGRLAGHTVVFVDPEQLGYAEQGDTSVLAEHRGHRLGMLLKSEMMCWVAAAEPSVRWIDTDNAESNRHMIAINEALGYQILARHLAWQRAL